MVNVIDSGSAGLLNPGFGGRGPVATANAIVRKTYLSCTLGDAISAQVSYGFDKMSGEARIVLPEPQGNIGDTVILSMGAGGLNTQRFSGTLRQFDYTLFPHSVTALCKGPCFAVEEYRNNFQTQDIDVLRQGMLFEDLIGSFNGATLQQIVTAVLDRVASTYGISYTTSGWDNPSHVYGLQANDNTFTWGTQETAADYLHKVLEASAGYRLFDSADGRIWLKQVSGIPAGTSDLTLTLGTDVLTDATWSDSNLGKQSAVLIEGWDDGFGPATSGIIGTGGSAFHISNPMIEDDAFATELANFWLPAVNRNQQLVRVSTPRDDLIGPGSTITVSGVSDSTMWVRSVVTEVTADGSFTQQLTCISS